MTPEVEQGEQLFQQALALENSGAPVAEVEAAYRKVLEVNPLAVGAMVNLGAIASGSRRFDEADDLFSQAIAADPLCALARFNLANLYDERLNPDKAESGYLRALALNPDYADAHYNLALLYDRAGSVDKALLHWQLYVRLRKNDAENWLKNALGRIEALQKAIGVTPPSKPVTGGVK